MYRSKINDLNFVLEEETNRIFVYKGSSEEPFSFISVEESITEKEFHYEIMDFAAKQGV